MIKNKLGIANSVYVIAEAGSNWRMGNKKRDLAMAKTLIDIAFKSGANAIKFQTFRPDTVYAPNAGKSHYLKAAGIKEDISEIFADLSMDYDFIPILSDYCKKLPIDFMSTAFSLDDFIAIDPYVQIHKIASYEISHPHLIKAVAHSKKPLILSTGASTLEDISWAVDLFRKEGGSKLCLLQCTAKYPAPLSSLNLNVIKQFKKEFDVICGLSDHSREPSIAPILAVGLGANVIEKHFTASNLLPGPDHPFALEPSDLKRMIEDIRLAEQALGDGGKNVHKEEIELAKFARRGLQAIKEIQPGERLLENTNYAVLRPGENMLGLHPKYIKDIEGKVTLRKIWAGEGITFECIK